MNRQLISCQRRTGMGMRSDWSSWMRRRCCLSVANIEVPTLVHQRRASLSLADLASAFEDIGLGKSQTLSPEWVGTPIPNTQRKPMTVPDMPRSLSRPATSAKAHYDALRVMPTNQLVEELIAASKQKLLDRGVTALFLLERRIRPGSGDESESMHLTFETVCAILKLFSCFGINQLETSSAAEWLELHVPGAHYTHWPSLLVDQCMSHIAQTAHDYTFPVGVQMLHLLGLCEDFYVEEIVTTLVDTVRLQLAPTHEGGTLAIHVASLSGDELSQALSSAILLAETISNQCRMVVPLLVQTENSPSVTLREKDQYYELENVKMLNVLRTAGHPVANEAFTTTVLLFIGTIFSELQSRGRLDAMISSQSWFFFLRALGKLPWLPEAAVTSMLPNLRAALDVSPSIFRGVLFLLGRGQVQSSHPPLVLKVLELQTAELQRSISARRKAVSRHQRRLRCIELTKLSSFLPLVHHMLKTNLSSLVSRSGKATPNTAPHDDARDVVKAIQTAAKALYTSLCDDLMESMSSVSDVCQAKLVDHVLHHLVCQAPRSLIHHPFVLHLAFAMSQTLPTLRFVPEASQSRLLAVMERLREEEIISDSCELSFSLMRRHPMIMAALEESLETKRLALLQRLRSDPAHSSSHRQRGHAPVNIADLPSYEGNPELVENNYAIAFVSLRKLVQRSRSE